MQTTLKMFGTLCGVGILAGCAATNQGMEVKVVPDMKASHSHDSADGHYAVGRYYHGARRFGDALKAYGRAIALDARHAKARNAMGVLYAESGRYADAIATLRDATTVDPDSSQLFSNLGYALYLNGDHADAAAALERATQLDPNNVHAWNNLGSVMKTLGRMDRSKASFAHARSLRTGQRSSLSMDAGTGGKPLAGKDIVGSLGQSSARPVDFAIGYGSEWGPRTELRQVGSATYEVYQVAGQGGENGTTAVEAPPPVAASRPTSLGVASAYIRPAALQAAYADAALQTSKFAIRLEISNGNGVNGMAKAVGRIIAAGSWRVTRLTNQPQFNVRTSRIEYGEGHGKMAHALAAELGHPIEVKQKGGGAVSDIRVVLGRDFPGLESLRAQFSSRLKMTESGEGPAQVTGLASGV